MSDLRTKIESVSPEARNQIAIEAIQEMKLEDIIEIHIQGLKETTPDKVDLHMKITNKLNRILTNQLKRIRESE